MSSFIKCNICGCEYTEKILMAPIRKGGNVVSKPYLDFPSVSKALQEAKENYYSVVEVINRYSCEKCKTTSDKKRFFREPF